MDLLLSLTEELCRDLLQSWLAQKDVVRLEVSYKGSDNHSQFCRILCHGTYRFSTQQPWPSDQAHFLYLKWLLDYSVVVTCIAVLPADSEEQRLLVEEFYKLRGPDLSELNIWCENVGSYMWKDTMIHCRNVVEATVHMEYDWNETLLHELNTACPKLERLNIHCTSARFDVPDDDEATAGWNFPVLTYLQIKNSIIMENCVARLAQLTPHLTSLRLQQVSFEPLDPDEPIDMQSMWPGLGHLFIEDGWPCKSLWKNRCNLISLHIEGKSFAYDDSLMHDIAENCTGLQHVTVACPLVTDVGVYAFAQTCTQLKRGT